MVEAKFIIGKAQNEFLNKHSIFGFKDKSTMVRRALDHLKKNIQTQNLEKSADLYTEIYNTDSELRDLTNASINEWPE